jgi:predicted Zn finger-like uncharacterized protein
MGNRKFRVPPSKRGRLDLPTEGGRVQSSHETRRAEPSYFQDGYEPSYFQDANNFTEGHDSCLTSVRNRVMIVLLVGGNGNETETTMNAICPNCKAAISVDPEDLATGAVVFCGKCGDEVTPVRKK